MARIPSLARRADQSGERQRIVTGTGPNRWQATAIPLPGQFVVVRLRPQRTEPPLLRSYSLSGPPGTERYRLGIKKESHGAASDYLAAGVEAGDILEVSAPRGSFVLRPGDRPIVLISAGIGVTPVLAMFHALAAGPSARQVWWLHGARNGGEHPFAEETRRLIRAPAARPELRAIQPTAPRG